MVRHTPAGVAPMQAGWPARPSRDHSTLGRTAGNAYLGGMTTLRPIALFALLALGACTPTLVWQKEGADDEERRQAQRLCARESQGYGFALERRDDASAERGAASAGGGVYRDCMERQGWRRYRDQPRG